MPKYSFKPRNIKEFITNVDANSLECARLYFAKIKALDIDTFNKLYEVVKR